MLIRNSGQPVLTQSGFLLAFAEDDSESAAEDSVEDSAGSGISLTEEEYEDEDPEEEVSDGPLPYTDYVDSENVDDALRLTMISLGGTCCGVDTTKRMVPGQVGHSAGEHLSGSRA